MILIRKVTTADSTATGGTVYIRKLYWKSPATIADTCVLQDGSANEEITLVCEVALQSQVVNFEGEGLRLNGYKISTLASGNLYLYG